MSQDGSNPSQNIIKRQTVVIQNVTCCHSKPEFGTFCHDLSQFIRILAYVGLLHVNSDRCKKTINVEV